MSSKLKQFEIIVRQSYVDREQKEQELPEQPLHPFDVRNIHPKLPEDVRKLFDDGHFAQATFEAFKFIDKEVQRHSKIKETGYNWEIRMKEALFNLLQKLCSKMSKCP